MTKNGSGWFEVDKEGLSALIERKGKATAVLELIQNGWDAPGCTEVDVTLQPIPNRSYALLTVRDDSPTGFVRLTDAFTLFARSDKITDAEKRGRFNLGEKLVLSLCEMASIISTTGGVAFDSTGRSDLKERTEGGSVFTATIKLSRKEIAEVEQRFQTLIPPAGVKTTFNGLVLDHRTPVATFNTALRTEIAGADSIMRQTTRKTDVNLYRPRPGETPSIYELGIPIVEWDSKWHIDIGQKVPLNFERDNVTPAYRQSLVVAALNHTFDTLTKEDAAAGWVKNAMADERAEPAAIAKVIETRFGEKAVAFDPSDQESNKEAVLQGYTVVHGASMSKEEWANARRADMLKPAGQVTPSNSTVETNMQGEAPIEPTEWTPAMHRIAEYTQALGVELLGYKPRVEMVRSTQYFAAAFGSNRIMFNLFRLGHAWFNDPNEFDVDALLLHEFAHDRVSDHLSEKFHTELCRLGAMARNTTSRLENFYIKEAVKS